MARSLNMVFFITLVLASTFLHGSLAQTTHVVGDALGWIVPPGGVVAYRTWAATKTFVVGDVLLFNFTSGIHDVAEVSKSSYDSCTAANPISMSTNGPTSITLTSPGEHNFICTITRHCDYGQKLTINVSGAPPPESTPPPVATPAPPTNGRVYTVGDALGWIIPPGGPIAYQTWAMGKNFIVGDSLVFNFMNGLHDVAEVTESQYKSCNTSSSTTPIFTGPATITLTSAGEHYYICTFTQHCTFGQKLAINVTGESNAPPPSSTTIPPRTSGGPLTPSTPSPDTAPPPLSSAPMFAATALPFTLLTVAFAFFYNY